MKEEGRNPGEPVPSSFISQSAALSPPKRGPLIIVSGPSGSGKSTVLARLLAKGDLPLHLSVSATTRRPRDGEVDGKHYYFWTREHFLQEQQAGAFLEWAEVHGNYYGTLWQEVEPCRAQGFGVLLDIDVQGAEHVRQQCPESISVFVQTSSPAVLEERLRRRGTEDEATIARRMQAARQELTRAGEYTHRLLNDNLEEAVVGLHAIVAEAFSKG